MPAGGVGHELRPGYPSRNFERLDDREPDAVNPHRVLADRVGCDVGQPLLHILADQLVTVAVQDEPDRRAALSLHSHKLRQPDNAEDRFAQLGPALAAEQARLSAASGRPELSDAVSGWAKPCEPWLARQFGVSWRATYT